MRSGVPAGRGNSLDVCEDRAIRREADVILADAVESKRKLAVGSESASTAPGVRVAYKSDWGESGGTERHTRSGSGHDACIWD